MPKRTIYIKSKAKLTTEHHSLKVETDAGTAHIPYEDIWVVILENSGMTITEKVLADMAENGIGLMFCGRNHMPIGLSLPLEAHSRHSAIVENQLAMSKPLKKRLWQRIVKSKIYNQARVLDYLGKEGADKMREFARQVLSGDSSNREAVAASLYFKQLIDKGTRRNSPFGNCLDFGYAVLRTGIAREAVAGGWLVSRGIHHSNALNAFNLVDDLIEPYRAPVDLLTAKLLSVQDYQLNPCSKQVLVSIFERPVTINGQTYCIQTAISETLHSFRDAVLAHEASLLLLPVTCDLDEEGER